MISRQVDFRINFENALQEVRKDLWQRNTNKPHLRGAWPLGVTRRRVRKLARDMARLRGKVQHGNG